MSGMQRRSHADNYLLVTRRLFVARARDDFFAGRVAFLLLVRCDRIGSSSRNLRAAASVARFPPCLVKAKCLLVGPRFVL
jgi:hypothetical protein